MKKLFFWVLPFVLIFMFFFHSNLVEKGHVPIKQLIIEFTNYEWVSFGTLYDRLKDIVNVITSLDYSNVFIPKLNIEFNSITDFFKVTLAILVNFYNMLTFYIDLVGSIFNFFLSILLALVYLLKDIVNIIAIFVRAFVI